MGRHAVDGVALTRTLGGHYMRQEDLGFFRPSRFHGRELAPAEDLSTVAWVIDFRAPVRTRPNGRITSRLAFLREVRVAGPPEGGSVTLADGGVLEADDVAILSPAEPPPAITAHERWIDVHLDSQTLIAYEGHTPVYATVVSSGRPWRGRETPRGEFRIWVKLATTTMDDLGNGDASDDYSVQAVPWVQYFQGSNGFHAAYWHGNFGSRVSHGCVNLSPTDARWLFGFTGPSLPDGWVNIRPTDTDPGTLVRIR